MKYECEMIEDLLPLYKDGICSASSKKIIDEHIAECPKCSEMLNMLKDTAIDDMIVKEKNEVISSQSKYFKRKSALAGSIIGGIFAIPILICLIVDMASGNGLGWFFIVLAAMLIPTSLFVIPLLAPKNRMFLSMTSLTGSIILLLAVCNIYSGGDWFFIAASSVLFGLSVCLSPFIACRRPVNAYLKNKKGLAVMALDTVTFYLMIVCIGIKSSDPMFFRYAFSISVPLIILTWIIFLIIRYVPLNGLAKAGICIAVLGSASYFVTQLILYLTIVTVDSMRAQYYSEPSALYMFIGLAIGVIFIIIGILTGKKSKKAEKM